MSNPEQPRVEEIRERERRATETKWFCVRCGQEQPGNPRWCVRCGHTVYRPVYGKKRRAEGEGQ